MSAIKYSLDFINDISFKYTMCALGTQLAIAELETAKNVLKFSYDGQADCAVNDTFDKIKEHLQLLGECLIQAGKYTTYVKGTAEATDNALSLTFSGGTK